MLFRKHIPRFGVSSWMNMSSLVRMHLAQWAGPGSLEHLLKTGIKTEGEGDVEHDENRKTQEIGVS